MLADRIGWMLDNHVHATWVSGTEAVRWYFYDREWVRIDGKLRRVWRRENDRDGLWLY